MNVKKSVATSSKEITTEHIHEFFGEYIAQIEEDKIAMLTATATEEKTAMYEKAIRKDMASIVNDMWNTQTLVILGNMFEGYIGKLTESSICPKTIAFSFNTPQTIGVFTIISDGDKKTEKDLILIEAEISSYYSDKGFKFDSIIFEESDNMTIPVGYKELTIKK